MSNLRLLAVSGNLHSHMVPTGCQQILQASAALLMSIIMQHS